MNKVLIIVGDAIETVDTLYPYYRLQEDGFEPVVAAPEKRRYQMVLHEVKPGWTITKEWEGYTIEADDRLSRRRSGGVPGHLLLRRPGAGIHPRRRGPVAHHAALLRCRQADRQRLPRRRDSGPRRLRQGPADGHRAPSAGSTWKSAAASSSNEPCVVDGNLVSGRTYHDHGHYMGAWIKMLNDARAKAAGKTSCATAHKV